MGSKLHRKQNIFPLTIEDIPKIIKIAEQSNLSRWTFKDYADEIERRDSIGLVYKKLDKVAEQLEENIVGFIVLRLIISKDTINQLLFSKNFQNITECEILNIAVHPAFRRNGIGQQLFDATVEKCLSENVESIWLEVRKNNDAAVKFYLRNGFEIIYTRKGYYQNPVDDALVMKAKLPQTASSKLSAFT